MWRETNVCVVWLEYLILDCLMETRGPCSLTGASGGDCSCTWDWWHCDRGEIAEVSLMIRDEFGAGCHHRDLYFNASLVFGVKLKFHTDTSFSLLPLSTQRDSQYSAGIPLLIHKRKISEMCTNFVAYSPKENLYKKRRNSLAHSDKGNHTKNTGTLCKKG